MLGYLTRTQPARSLSLRVLLLPVNSTCSRRSFLFHVYFVTAFNSHTLASMYLALSSLSAFSTLLISLARADCECGYTVNSTLYTDLIESDFLHLQNITTDTDWIRQEYQVSAELARGPYGKDAQQKNVVTNPLKSQYDWSGNGINGGDAGIQLIVRGGDPGKGNLIPMAEMVTNRTDILYGSFRAGMKIAGINGTCGAFFWVCLEIETRLAIISVNKRNSISMTLKRSIWNS